MNASKIIFYFLFFILVGSVCIIINTGCAEIGSPTGGPKDTIPPVLVKALPSIRTTHFNGNKIVLTFNEYIDVQDAYTNVLVSPYPKKNPAVTFKLKTLTILLKDSLLPNTTYSIDFGNAIRDNNEGNILKNFVYVFSTGNFIDSETVSGKVILAETGKTDSTILVFLYKNLDDTAVLKTRPDYVARVDGKGNFTFIHLPPGDFNIYALKDENGSKTYDSKMEAFGFIDHIIHVSDTNLPDTLYAYQEEKKREKSNSETTTSSTKRSKSSKDDKLKFSTSFNTDKQDLLTTANIFFNHPLKTFDSTKIFLTDTFYHPIANTNITIDSTRKKVSIQTKWDESTDYRFIIDTFAVRDSNNATIKKTDTLAFKTKSESDYGSILIRLLNFDPAKHPVLEFVKDDKIIKSVPFTSAEWSDKLFYPGEYHLRVLFDTNNNGVWDPGNYQKKIQPEKVISFDKKLIIKADWDNEQELQL